MSQEMTKAVILARGLGTRMRKSNENAALTAEQAKIAETGVKALIPIDRPFLDYVLHNLAEAGYQQVCLVIGPEHDAVRNYYTNEVKTSRVKVSFAIQQEPLGTADAVAAAQQFAQKDHFIVINSDNYYPLNALKGLRQLNSCGLAGFEREALIAHSNIPANRVNAFAVINIDSDNNMSGIIEKPTSDQLASVPLPHYLSMNCWRFGPSIFEACANISKSTRGEFELPDAVSYSCSRLNETYKVVPVSDGVLDLSCREDIQQVIDRLKGSPVNI
ncbi:MAG: NTP transferase domain-containing protein [Sedimentisphaerales bacterium]|nr:NTP transferase domain-containing protein [Sedimentisphaerales bacterium]MBN2841875.1 NTP transferase domain-containing protein [Sedimentisphaerales bacterium]